MSNEEEYHPIRRQGRRQSLIDTGPVQVVQPLTQEEWAQAQDQKQAEAVERHNENLKREYDERAAVENAGRPKTKSELLDGVDDRMPLQPLPEATVENNVVKVPGRGPATNDEGGYLDDGSVPVARNKVKSKGKVADARARARK